MPGGKSAAKNSGKPVRQLLFSEALLHSKTSPPAPVAQQPAWTHTMSDPAQESTMDRILQEISAVGRRLEGMDNAMALLTAKTKSIHLDIAGFQSCVMGLEQRVTMVEAQAATSQDWDRELLYLRSKLTGLKDRSRRDNVRFLGFPETIEDFYDLEDLRSFLDSLIPMDTSAPVPPHESSVTDQTTLSRGPAPGGSGSERHPTVSHPRGRDSERLMNSHDDRGQVLHAVALHTQVADRNKSGSPLKPPTDAP
ncbi:hypothetical protein NDU88_003395 [Pleurodeles waltl]|uniref:Uncharacterized protein n=1 Tax=Pleurodeles waltl TaxID=8319 RepID=A0AAV7V167_PLEWA|nr:hypothetical protein NDU88_003395 [Pleurodeles waltl]